MRRESRSMADAAPKNKSAPQKALEKLGLVRDIDLALHLPLRYEDETRHRGDRLAARRRRGPGGGRRHRQPHPVPPAPPARRAPERRQRRPGAALPALLSLAPEGARRGRARARARRGPRRLLRAGDGAPGVQGGGRRHAARRGADAGLSDHGAASAGLPAQGDRLGPRARRPGGDPAGRAGADAASRRCARRCSSCTTRHPTSASRRSRTTATRRGSA